MEEVRGTFGYSTVTDDEFAWCLRFITTGGASLTAYNEYRKVLYENGRYFVDNRMIAMRHRLSIGTIVGDTSLLVKYVSGKYLGMIEEYFIAALNPGDVFWFAGRAPRACSGERKRSSRSQFENVNRDESRRGKAEGCRCRRSLVK
ncbi:MAG: hypothetical protein WDO15_04035 [Bacteroidota bacterium]